MDADHVATVITAVESALDDLARGGIVAKMRNVAITNSGPTRWVRMDIEVGALPSERIQDVPGL